MISIIIVLYFIINQLINLLYNYFSPSKSPAQIQYEKIFGNRSLEKDKETGNVSYDPDNHQFMVKVRAEKIAKIADYIPEQHFDTS